MAHRMCLRGSLPSTHLSLGIGAVVIWQLLLTYAPPLQVLFETATIPLRIWPRLLFNGFVFFFVEAEKLITRLTRLTEDAATSVRAH
jgi:hypothetical protein